MILTCRIMIEERDEQHCGAALGWLIEEDSESLVALKDSTLYAQELISQGRYSICYVLWLHVQLCE